MTRHNRPGTDKGAQNRIERQISELEMTATSPNETYQLNSRALPSEHTAFFRQKLTLKGENSDLSRVRFD